MRLDLAQLQDFLLGFTLINFALLMFSFVISFIARPLLVKYYCPLIKMSEEQFMALYFKLLAQYKILILLLGLTPYLVLKFWM